MNELIYYDEITQSLSKAVKWGGENLRDVPGLLKMVLEREMWKKRYVVMTGQEVGFDSFNEYVTASVPEGLGASIDIIRRLCKDTEVMPLLDREITAHNGHGTNQKSGVATASPTLEQQGVKPGSNSRAYNISALKTMGHHDIAEQLSEGKITVEQAKKQAGIPVDDRIKIPIANPQRAAEMILEKMPREVIDELVSLLLEGIHKNQ